MENKFSFDFDDRIKFNNTTTTTTTTTKKELNLEQNLTPL